ncbi:hypothetical protein BDE02_03G003900 [Populus trichocarpa]|nr:hypothetical protein BDE02_03G003900 [Populus trichocarpa]
MALQYPLLFPYGEDGYSCNIMFVDHGHEKTRKRSRVPMRAYYAYLINERPGCDNTIIKGGRLYQQFLVNAFVNVEEDRLDYIRANKKDLRTEVYKGIHEAVLNGDVEGFSTGKIIVPSSLTGSPRYMINNYQDAMAICRAYGNPDLFITFTCNVNWPEIRRELTKGRIYKHEDKPDIITHVFRSMVIDMLAFIKSGKTFGQIIAEWIPRSKGFSLNRLTYVHPASGELYFLRLLLNHVRGALSFDYLKNVSGVTLGLLGDDKEWEDVFCEAMTTATSPQIRNLFVSVVLFCDVADLELLFNKFWRSMYDDIITRFKSSFAMPNLKLFDDELKNYVLYELELLFNVAGTSLEKHKLPMPDGRLLSEIKTKLLREELNYDIADLICQHSSAFPQLNQCQLNVYDCVIKSVLEKRKELIFVHGYGGTGKTFLWHTIINRLRSDEMTSLIVWDEAPMNNRCCFKALDRSLRDVLTNGNDLPNDKPFGGKSILLGGDFRQILPVIPRGTKEDIVHASLCSSVLWSKFKVLTLTENMRLSSNGLSNDQKKELAIFANWILAIGDGTQHDALFPDDSDASMIKIPQDLLLEPGSNPILAIVSAVYPSIRDINIDPCYFRDRAIVTPRNATVSEINDFILNMLPGMKRIYLTGLCNGTSLIVTQLAERVIEAQIITGSFIGNRVFIPRIVFPINDAKCPFTIKRRQFPIRPCYAMTINKSQGQSLKVVGVFLKDQVFTHGQLYVALSRVTSRQGLKIITCDAEGNHSFYVKNIVYKDVLSSLSVS